MKLKNIIKKPDFLKWRVKRSLIKRYKYLLKVNEIMEAYITKRIVDGQTERRKELVSKTQEIEEMKVMINYFRNL